MNSYQQRLYVAILSTMTRLVRGQITVEQASKELDSKTPFNKITKHPTNTYRLHYNSSTYMIANYSDIVWLQADVADAVRWVTHGH